MAVVEGSEMNWGDGNSVENHGIHSSDFYFITMVLDPSHDPLSCDS